MKRFHDTDEYLRTLEEINEQENGPSLGKRLLIVGIGFGLALLFCLFVGLIFSF